MDPTQIYLEQMRALDSTGFHISKVREYLTSANSTAHIKDINMNGEQEKNFEIEILCAVFSFTFNLLTKRPKELKTKIHFNLVF